MIDWDRTLELRDEMGAEGFEEVIELFLSEVEQTLDQLDGAAQDAAALESVLHFLKGAALNLGFADLATLCATGEAAAAQGNIGIVAPQQVKQTYADSKQAFLTDLPAKAA